MEHQTYTTYLSASDAARLLSVTPATVRLMYRRGELLLAAKTEGGVHLFTRPEVERVAAARALLPRATARGLRAR